MKECLELQGIFEMNQLNLPELDAKEFHTHKNRSSPTTTAPSTIESCVSSTNRILVRHP